VPWTPEHGDIRGEATPLVDFLLIGIITWLVVLPLTILVHELGHACVILGLLRRPVMVELGSGPKGYDITLGLLTIRLRLLSGPIGFCRYDDEGVTLESSVLFDLAGPLASLGFAVLIYKINQTDALSPLFAGIFASAVYAAAVNFVVTAVPVTYPSWCGPYAGMQSDGYRFCKGIRALLSG